MSDSIIEHTRQIHSDLEKLVDVMIDDILDKKKSASHKEMILRDHRLKASSDLIVDKSKKLLGLYDDKTGSRKKELSEITGPNVFSTFYARLKATRDYHRKHPGASVKLDDSVTKPIINPNFTGEENYCKYVDMHNLYKRYTNMKVFDKCNYYSYLGKFQKLHLVKKEKKVASKEYQAYTKDTLNYLSSFFEKRHPLANIGDVKRQIEEEFETKWKSGEVLGWGKDEQKDEEVDEDAIEYAPIDLSKYNSAEQLEGLGMDCLKAELKRVGLKTGGRLQERAKRLWMLKNKTIDQISRKYRAKGHVVTATAKDLARVEFLIKMFYELLRPQIDATREYIEKKLTKTYEEIQAEREQDSDEEVEDDSDDDERQLYNPLKLPLGWDGKPIPYWLYKLHGLNIEYKCEICGNYSYWGPRSFSRHFNEWRHSYGMKCLGITNTKEFENITLIEDAITLNRKLQKLSADKAWKPEEEEEFEDKEGHVYNKKTYDDLKRQGLV